MFWWLVNKSGHVEESERALTITHWLPLLAMPQSLKDPSFGVDFVS